jgi:hypothetical protein
MISSMSGGNGMDNKISVYLFVCLLYCSNTICCIVETQFILLLTNKFVVFAWDVIITRIFYCIGASHA